MGEGMVNGVMGGGNHYHNSGCDDFCSLGEDSCCNTCVEVHLEASKGEVRLGDALEEGEEGDSGEDWRIWQLQGGDSYTTEELAFVMLEMGGGGKLGKCVKCMAEDASSYCIASPALDVGDGT
ncbi:hypothetical protein BDQ17DRAFT_1331902 [Cyathus striatus]|nr:hypothetical protein BDQ17DRAFT_1331902 [Cyathus striatus]